MARIVVLSDIHSPTHGFFWENWCVAREFADAAKADAVIVNGDLAINGPDSDAEIAFAATALGNLRTPVMALPAVTMKEGKTMTARRLSAPYHPAPNLTQRRLQTFPAWMRREIGPSHP
jgi:predicted MPP superfamily phosphohydrolase